MGPSATLYWPCYFSARMVLLGLFRIRAFGQANVPREGGVILAANHASFLDPVVIGSALTRPMESLARETLFKVPGLGFLLSRIRAHALAREERDIGAIRKAIHLVRGGACLLIFPEGTRSVDGRLGLVRSGVGLLARRAKAPVIPVLVEGTFRAWPRQRVLPRPAPVSVFFERPLAPEGPPERLAAAIREAWMSRQMSRV